LQESTQTGQSIAVPFSISKTGDGTGEIVGGGGLTGWSRFAYGLTYANGVITIDIENKSDDGRPYGYVQGTMNATFDEDRNVLIAGSFRVEVDAIDIGPIVYFPRNSYYWVTQLTGSKPAG
jgi:hypothetical protein